MVVVQVDATLVIVKVCVEVLLLRWPDQVVAQNECAVIHCSGRIIVAFSSCDDKFAVTDVKLVVRS